MWLILLFRYRSRSDRGDQQYKQSNHWGGPPSQINMAPVQDFGGPKPQYAKKQQNQDEIILTPPDWQETNLKPFRKDFYEPNSTNKNRSQYDVDNYREVNDIIVRGDNIPNPNFCFEEGSFPEYIMQILGKQGFKEPTAIQSQGRVILLHYLKRHVF